ncbi:MAG TPA: riboflavin synthase [Syntrophorhabdaceae bacterium]|nr:riboflavin synthase [Syntrophorhabdaceae bacterium]HOL05331.1 riboflavin synthase [Syntrophorhabdaceae bacterium]HON85070.1 riboflavin synthase [Syntrophorhabdaceae bacterium]HOT41511.1 riboflavin synthase [Syntrophorhabdaceae bacterium]HPC65809.1 riboflavin synthase [Syntrophorhabdaceae bacterium]
MFTGIIEDIGEITAINKTGGRWEFSIKTRLLKEDVKEGDSICVDGVCLTVTRLSGINFYADASYETINVTTLGKKSVGDRVNLERAMGAGARFGGHFVTGHVDCIGTIRRKEPSGDSVRLSIEVPEDISRFIVKKGSVSIDGISLTVNSKDDNIFTVNIIPYTSMRTTIGEKEVGSSVNIETDIIGKYVDSFLEKSEKKGIDMDFLYKHGYIKGV